MKCAQCGADLVAGLGFCLQCAQETAARGAQNELEVSLGPADAPPRQKVLTLLAALTSDTQLEPRAPALRITGPDDGALERLGRWLTMRGAEVRLRAAGEAPRWRFGFQATPLAAGLVLVPALSIAAAVVAAAQGVAIAGAVVTTLLVLHVFGPRPASTHLALEPALPGLDTIDATVGEHLRLVRRGLSDPEAITALAAHVKAAHALLEIIRADGEHLSSDTMRANDEFLAVELREATRLAQDADRQRKLLAGGVASDASARAERRRQASLRALTHLTTHLTQAHQRLLGLAAPQASASLLTSLGEHRSLIVRLRDEAGHQP